MVFLLYSSRRKQLTGFDETEKRKALNIEFISWKMNKYEQKKFYSIIVLRQTSVQLSLHWKVILLSNLMRTLFTGIACCYRPQRSCGKVMFFTPVCDSVHKEGGSGRYPSLGRHAQANTPPGQTPPPKTETAADGTHSTGMHSCFLLCDHFTFTPNKLWKLVDHEWAALLYFVLLSNDHED